MYPNRSSPLWKRLYREACRTRVVDCHAHTVSREEYEYQAPRLGLFTMKHYFERDIVGMEEVHGLCWSKCRTDVQRWKVFREALHLAGNVSYYRHNWHTYRLLYGLGNEELNDANWKAIHTKIRQCARRKGWYRYLLKEKAGIDLMVKTTPFADTPSSLSTDIIVPRRADAKYGVSAVYVGALLTLGGAEPLRQLEQEANVDIRSAASLVLAINGK